MLDFSYWRFFFFLPLLVFSRMTRPVRGMISVTLGKFIAGVPTLVC